VCVCVCVCEPIRGVHMYVRVLFVRCHVVSECTRRSHTFPITYPCRRSSARSRRRRSLCCWPAANRASCRTLLAQQSPTCVGGPVRGCPLTLRCVFAARFTCGALTAVGAACVPVRGRPGAEPAARHHSCVYRLPHGLLVHVCCELRLLSNACWEQIPVDASLSSLSHSPALTFDRRCHRRCTSRQCVAI
jgi:hypothetical protein